MAAVAILPPFLLFGSVMSDLPYQPPVEPSKFAGDANAAAALFEPLYRRRTWMRIVGIVLVVFGAIYCISIIGAIFGIPMIIMGLYLHQAAGHFESGFRGYAEQLHEGADKLARTIQIAGILTLVGVVLMVLYFAVLFVVLAIGIVGSAP